MKRLLLAFVVAFVLTLGGGFLVHGMLLHGDYAQLPNLLRTEQDAQPYFGYMLLGDALFAFAFVWIYRQGLERKPWLAQGVRFGLLIWALALVSNYLIYYAVQPWPGMVVAKQIAFDGVKLLVMGIAVAAVYKGEAESSARATAGGA